MVQCKAQVMSTLVQQRLLAAIASVVAMTPGLMINCHPSETQRELRWRAWWFAARCFAPSAVLIHRCRWLSMTLIYATDSLTLGIALLSLPRRRSFITNHALVLAAHRVMRNNVYLTVGKIGTEWGVLMPSSAEKQLRKPTDET